jgi:hypothetical protein
MSEQFASIGDLLSRLDGGGAASRAPARPPGSGVAPKLPVQSPAQSPAQKKNSGEVSASLPLPQGAELTLVVQASSLKGPESRAGSPHHTETVIDVPDDDDNDALPSVGRVWEGPAPSLGAILKKHAAGGSASTPPPPRPGPVTGSNIEPVSATDLPAVWQAFLDLLKEHGPGLHSILSHGRYVGIEDGRAVIRFGAQHETFVKMLDRNGKKDLVRDAIARVLKQSIGVRFEVETAADAEAVASPAAPVGERPPAARPKTPEPAAAPPPPVPSVKITPELIESIRTAEPLVKALMDELGAQIVKVE